MNNSLQIVKDTSLSYHQQVFSLAKEAENSIDVLNLSQGTKELIEKNVICTLFEGNAPYRPRYIIPDYQVLMDRGCRYLELDPPRNIWEATDALLILYKHVPSIDYFPVYLGNLDSLLSPFVRDDEESALAIRLFLRHIDRTLSGSFVHANIGPEESLAGRMILEASAELNTAVPNLTLKYDPEKTSRDFLNLACRCALETAKPSFANHRIYRDDFAGGDYAIASCYNGLFIGGGGYTLNRLKLNNLAKDALSTDDFLNKLLPLAARTMLAYMDERIRFLSEESAFFDSSFLVKEGFISKDKFTGMFGIVGLAEAVNSLLDADAPATRFGRSGKADALGLEIIKTLDGIVREWKSPYVGCFDGRHLLHAQVGIDSDEGCSPGCRIPVGEEPDTMDHILQSAPFHPYFASGIGDIYAFEKSYKERPEALADIVRGALASGLRYFSAYSEDSDVVRVTGYLVKRSEMEKLEKGEAVINQSTVLGLGMKQRTRVLERRVRSEN